MKKNSLIVDFDNTLIFGDSLIMSIKCLSLLQIIKIISSIKDIKSKVDFKKYLFNKNLMVKHVSFNNTILDFVISRNAYIVTGAIDQYVKLLLCDFVSPNRIFGTKDFNLTGNNKKEFLVKKFGYKKFDYIGDSFSDICVWKAARKAYTVKRYWIYKFFVPYLMHIDEIK